MKMLRYFIIVVAVGLALTANLQRTEANWPSSCSSCGHSGIGSRLPTPSHTTFFGNRGGAGHAFKNPKLPVFQAAPWYQYWPYDGHFQTPAPVGGAFYGPPMTGNFPVNPYFPGAQAQASFGGDNGYYAAPLQQPTPVPQAAPLQQPTPVPQGAPLQQPAPVPQAAPLQQPTPVPQAAPLQQPTPVPQAAPLQQPTPVPQAAPLQQPTPVPQTNAPAPMQQPTAIPPLAPPIEPPLQPGPVPPIAPSSQPPLPVAPPQTRPLLPIPLPTSIPRGEVGISIPQQMPLPTGRDGR